MNRTKFVGPDAQTRMRVNSVEYIALQRLAAFESLSSLSEAWRLVLREACHSRGIWPRNNGAQNEEQQNINSV